jgi:hypothetical protein
LALGPTTHLIDACSWKRGVLPRLLPVDHARQAQPASRLRVGTRLKQPPSPTPGHRRRRHHRTRHRRLQKTNRGAVRIPRHRRQPRALAEPRLTIWHHAEDGRCSNTNARSSSSHRHADLDHHHCRFSPPRRLLESCEQLPLVLLDQLPVRCRPSHRPLGMPAPISRVSRVLKVGLLDLGNLGLPAQDRADE